MLEAACVTGYVYRFRPQNLGIYHLETITRSQNQFIGKLTALLGVSGMMAKLLAAGSEE